jgi:hypothetical protein
MSAVGAGIVKRLGCTTGSVIGTGKRVGFSSTCVGSFAILCR